MPPIDEVTSNRGYQKPNVANTLAYDVSKIRSAFDAIDADTSGLFSNMGQSHGTRLSFDATTPSYGFGWRYVQGSTNGPGTGGTQFYSAYIGLGSEYPATGVGSYGMYLAIERNFGSPYLSIRYNENNALTGWRKISAGKADVLTTARTINGTSFDGSANITITANSPTSLTFNNGGAGDASGSTFNGGSAVTVSYNSIGALPSVLAQQGGKSYVAHDFNTYPNLYDVTFVNPTGSTNLPTGMGNVMSYRFIMGAGDTASRGFDLVGAAESSGNLYMRERSIGTWSRILHSNNYNTYAPTLAGTGASGTWGINVTGNAATATSASNLSGGNQTGSYEVTSGQFNRWGHASQSDANDGKIGAGLFASGLNIIGTQTTAGTGRQIRLWGSLIDSYGTSYVLNSGTWNINITGSCASTAGCTFSNDSSTKDDITTRTETGFYQTSTATVAEGWPLDSNAWMHLISCTHSNDANYYSMQIAASFYGTDWYFRNTNGSGATTWRTMLHNGNYNSYAPTLTGAGANGTWGINITGSSGYASSAGDASTMGGGRVNTNAYGYLRVSDNGVFNSGFLTNHQFYNSQNNPVFIVYNTLGSFADVQYYSVVDRPASSAYYFMRMHSNFPYDAKYNVRGDGAAFCDLAWYGGGADYAEYFEWADGNINLEDRRGVSVVLDDNKIRPAQAGEDPIGVISGNPSVVGDAAWSGWTDKYLRDDYGTFILEDYKLLEWIDENGKKKSAIVDSPEAANAPEDATVIIQQRQKLNPAYDENQEYIPREERPEWDCVGLMGKLRIRKGQPTGSRWIKMRDISENVEEWLVR